MVLFAADIANATFGKIENMAVKSNISFRNPLVQRLVYGVLTIVWSGLAGIGYSSWWEGSEIGIQYFYIFLIVLLSLIFQLVFNNKVGWIILLFLWISFTLFMMGTFIVSLIERLRWTVKGGMSFDSVFVTLLLFLGLFAFAIFLYKMKPIKSLNSIYGSSKNS